MSKDFFSDSGSVGTIKCTESPKLNVMERDDFLERASIVFQAYEDILKKTLGAYGSPTIISTYPYKHVTKDGFTVCRNIEFDQFEGSEVDKVIGGMITDICGRLNYSVGDGTTSAIIGTNKVFQAFMNAMRTNPEITDVRPKEFMEVFQKVTDSIVEKLNASAIHLNPENLSEGIRKIVHISSNGNAEMVDIITSIYDEIGFPAIVCETSDTSETYYEITDGYNINVKLGDDVYINNDNDTAFFKNADVLIFGQKVTSSTYENIIKPLNDVCRVSGRKLICLAPWYDDKLLTGEIRRSLLKELKEKHTINLIIGSYFSGNDIAKQQIADLAIVLGTTVIDRDLEDIIVDKMDKAAMEGKGESEIVNIVNIFDRAIPGILVTKQKDSGDLVRSEAVVYDEDRLKDTVLDLGFCDTATIGKKSSVFKASHYDDELYNTALRNAENKLDEVIKKFTELGTYTRDVYEAQNRVCSLKMKIAKIYVGGESDMSKDLLKDSTEDAIRAAESAYRYGYVPGCNFTITKSADELIADPDSTPLERTIASCIASAFKSVYCDVLCNAFGEISFPMIYLKEDVDAVITFMYNKMKINTEESVLRDLIAKFVESLDSKNYTIGEEVSIPGALLLVELSHIKGQVFDLDIMDFSDDVINSVKTDVEILKATSDLLSILVVGNQVLVASWNHTHVRNN
jgi:chaperonin GroEL (HSP60 family)